MSDSVQILQDFRGGIIMSMRHSFTRVRGPPKAPDLDLVEWDASRHTGSDPHIQNGRRRPWWEGEERGKTILPRLVTPQVGWWMRPDIQVAKPPSPPTPPVQNGPRRPW